MNICLNCQHIAQEYDFLENLGHCPQCNDETITELKETQEDEQANKPGGKIF